MNSHTASALLLAILITGCDADLSPKSTSSQRRAGIDPKLKELASLPVGLEVTHTPNPVRAQHGGRSGLKYTWLYKTTVRTTRSSVTINEFGAFFWDDGQWVFGNHMGKPFTSVDFADWYSCPNATVMVDQEVSDPSNWVGSDILRKTKAKWYFIGTDENGNRVKGEAVIEELAEIDE